MKPENVFVTTEGRIKVLDFGLAKVLRPEVAEPQDPTASLPPTDTEHDAASLRPRRRSA